MGRKFGFSWKRASGLSAAKGKLSRKIGVPLTKEGRRRKFGKLLSLGSTKPGAKSGCASALVPVAALLHVAWRWMA